MKLLKTIVERREGRSLGTLNERLKIIQSLREKVSENTILYLQDHIQDMSIPGLLEINRKVIDSEGFRVVVYDLLILQDGELNCAYINITLSLLIKVLQSDQIWFKAHQDALSTDTTTIDIYDD